MTDTTPQPLQLLIRVDTIPRDGTRYVAGLTLSPEQVHLILKTMEISQNIKDLTELDISVLGVEVSGGLPIPRIIEVTDALESLPEYQRMMDTGTESVVLSTDHDLRELLKDISGGEYPHTTLVTGSNLTWQASSTDNTEYFVQDVYRTDLESYDLKSYLDGQSR